MTINIDSIYKCIPETVQDAIRTHQTEKLGAARMNCDEVTFENVSRYLGEKIANRRRKWRAINEGLQSLAHLQKR